MLVGNGLSQNLGIGCLRMDLSLSTRYGQGQGWNAASYAYVLACLLLLHLQITPHLYDTQDSPLRLQFLNVYKSALSMSVVIHF